MKTSVVSSEPRNTLFSLRMRASNGNKKKWAREEPTRRLQPSTVQLASVSDTSLRRAGHSSALTARARP